MAQLNLSARQMLLNIVYYGPPGAGKRTTLESLHAGFPPPAKTKLIVLSDEEKQNTFFDVVPPGLGSISPFESTRLQVKGSSEGRFLEDADGVVCVIDSGPRALEANRRFLADVENTARSFEATLLPLGALRAIFGGSARMGGVLGVRMHHLPVILQYNKRDLVDAIPVPQLDHELNGQRYPTCESVASRGLGVRETLSAISQAALQEMAAYRKQLDA